MTEKYFTVRFVLEFIIPLCIVALAIVLYLFVKLYTGMCDWRYKRLQKMESKKEEEESEPLTYFEIIKNADIDEMAEIIFKLDQGLLCIPKLYACGNFDCFNNKCRKCYIKWLGSEVKNGNDNK